MKIFKIRNEAGLLCIISALFVTVSLIAFPNALTDENNLPSESSSASQESVSKKSGSAVTQNDVSTITDEKNKSGQSNGTDISALSADLKENVYPYENKDILVKATPENSSSIPSGSILCVEQITKENNKKTYLEIENQISENMKKKSRKVTGFLAYNIYFLNNGHSVEPENGSVTVTIKYKNGLFDSKIKKNSDEIRTLHFTEINGKIEDITKSVSVKDIGKSKIKSDSKSNTDIRQDEVTFTTRSFSVFVVTASSPDEQDQQLSASDIMNLLDPVQPFAVFAREFHLTGSEVEGCIAAEQAEINGDFGIKTISNNYLNYSNTITVEKKYEGHTPETFSFGLYDLKGSKIKTELLDFPQNSEKSKKITFNVDKDVKDYSVNELDNSGNIIELGSDANGYRLTKSERANESVSSLNMESTSYIKNLIKIDKMNCHLNDPQTTALPPYNKLIVGNGTVESYNQGTQLKYGNGSIDYGNHPEQTFTVLKNNFPIDFDTVLNKMTELSEKLARLQDSETVTVKNYKVDDLKTNNNLTFSDIGDSHILLINIDATNYESSFNFPAESKLTVDNNQVTGWHKDAPRIIINIYTKSGNAYLPYSGSITGTENIGGTLLVPLATVNINAGAYNGRVIANKLTDSVEIHSSASGTYGDNIVWNFVNTEITGITIPETGGKGTYFYYITGGTVLLFGIALIFHNFIHRKKVRH